MKNKVIFSGVTAIHETELSKSNFISQICDTPQELSIFLLNMLEYRFNELIKSEQDFEWYS